MSFLDHLDEFRTRLIRSAIAWVILTVGLWFVSGDVLDLLVGDLPVDSLYFQSPTEAFMARTKISLVLGLMVAFPYILYNVWAFVSPGLFDKERRHVYPLMIASSILFYVGVGFCYIVLIPIVLKFLLGFGTENLNPLLSVGAYFAFVARLSFTFGLVFQLPIVVLVLSSMGLVTPQFLLKQWRYGIVIIFVSSAILTPPDAVSLLMMALPIVLLYIVSILIALAAVRKKEKSETE